jgi:hypothetical protein
MIRIDPPFCKQKVGRDKCPTTKPKASKHSLRWPQDHAALYCTVMQTTSLTQSTTGYVKALCNSKQEVTGLSPSIH